jgi:hypothetical protein
MCRKRILIIATLAAFAVTCRSANESALDVPLPFARHEEVGASATGRADGENYQIGFLDTCDTPYAKTIAASREIGQGLYQLRTMVKGQQ